MTITSNCEPQRDNHDSLQFSSCSNKTYIFPPYFMYGFPICDSALIVSGPPKIWRWCQSAKKI